jgi:hypothetical protein
MAQEKTAEIVIRYDGETADSGRLKLFEASESLEGTTRVVNLVVHAFVNKNEIRERLTAPSGANTYLSSARKGCFEESIEIDFGAEVVSRIKPSVIIPNFWDYFTCCIEVAVGRDYDASMPMVKKIQGRTESFFEEMAEELEAPLQLLHDQLKQEVLEQLRSQGQKVGTYLF